MLANVCLRKRGGGLFFHFLLISTAIAMAIGIRVLLFERYSSHKGHQNLESLLGPGEEIDCHIRSSSIRL